MRDRAWPGLVSSAAVLAVPLGATEQHGPHLPLTTDTDVAVALVGRLAAARDDVVAAPAVAYGASGEHAAFPGTLSIGSAVLGDVLVELRRSASCERLLFVNAHGGNVEAARRAVAVLRGEGRDTRLFTPAWGGDAHAGRTETSLMLALRPEAVQVAAGTAGNVAPLASLMPALRAGGVAAVSPNGVLGDPAGASAAEGEALLDAAVAQLSASLDSWPIVTGEPACARTT